MDINGLCGVCVELKTEAQGSTGRQIAVCETCGVLACEDHVEIRQGNGRYHCVLCIGGATP